jgi:hypothetical protein
MPVAKIVSDFTKVDVGNQVSGGNGELLAFAKLLEMVFDGLLG